MHPFVHASMHPCIHASMHPCIHASIPWDLVGFCTWKACIQICSRDPTKKTNPSRTHRHLGLHTGCAGFLAALAVLAAPAALAALAALAVLAVLDVLAEVAAPDSRASLAKDKERKRLLLVSL